MCSTASVKGISMIDWPANAFWFGKLLCIWYGAKHLELVFTEVQLCMMSCFAIQHPHQAALTLKSAA